MKKFFLAVLFLGFFGFFGFVSNVLAYATCAPYHWRDNPNPVLPCSYNGYDYDSLAVENGAYVNSFFFKGSKYVLTDNEWYWSLASPVYEVQDGILYAWDGWHSEYNALGFSKSGALFFGVGASYSANVNLAVIIEPSEGGNVEVNGVPCQSFPCQFQVSSNKEVGIIAKPKDGFVFAYWHDGTNQITENPHTFIMDSAKTLTAFFAWNNKITLKAGNFYPIPIGTRIPLILIHGNNMETEDQFGWKDYIKKIKKNIFFQSRYKVYLFSWDSEQSNSYNGMALGKMIDSLPELANENLTILAHSRGGLVARYFMNQYKMKSGNKAGQLGGEKVNWLVTLATPHRGSPGADPIWVEASLDFNFIDRLEFILSDFYFNNIWDSKSYPFILWDDVDNKLTDQKVCYNSVLNSRTEECNFLMSKTTLNGLIKFNQDELYFNKIIAYGGNNYAQSLSDRTLYWIWMAIALNNQTLSNWNLHQGLEIATLLMERMPMIPPGCDRVPANPERPFKANDGMVPLTSALFLKPGAFELFQFDKNGRLRHDKGLLNSFFCQVAECHVADGKIDHLDFLDDSGIISSVLSNLNSLR